MRNLRLATFLVCGTLLVGGAALSAGSPGTASRVRHRVSAQDLLRKVVEHEISADKEDQSHWMYESTERKPGRVVTKEVIETKQGDLDRLLSINGKEISEEQQKSESERIQKLV